LDAKRAAALAVYLHALSGRQWHRDRGADRGMLAREIADGMPSAIAELATGARPLPV
jgi:NAD(P)H-hydrate repair Nnr-like enzyme with NAD(P)H-hydrate dehydratase domain